VSQSVYASAVAQQGLSEAHEKLLAAVPAGATVLEVGCASGYFTQALLERGAAAVDGIEVDPEDAARAEPHLRRLIVDSVESPAVTDELDDDAYDAIVCGDVLEHLRDPWDALAFLATLLRPGGIAAVSVPNVAHWTGRRALLRGRFPYAEHGLFDRTHLRFFTRAGARALVEGADLRVRTERFAPAPLPLQSRVPGLGRLAAPAARAWPELFALQVVLAAERAVSGPSTPDRASR
jgi:SAM-dependent methyltransferase